MVLITMLAGIQTSCTTGRLMPADQMGLSKGSVYAVPEQRPHRPGGAGVGANKLLPRAFLNAPPQIPHDIDDFLPITATSNLCIACHSRPDDWGKPYADREATPIPRSHYTDLRRAPGVVTGNVIAARHNCSQCHVPQMEAQPLVDNSFGDRSAQ
jgi:cytochrome c-type protein NapB